MSDSQLRQLEKLAHQGDRQAGTQLVEARRRLGLPAAVSGEYVIVYFDNRVRWCGESRFREIPNEDVYNDFGDLSYTEIDMLDAYLDDWGHITYRYLWTADFYVEAVVGFDATERDARKYLRSLLGRR